MAGTTPDGAGRNDLRQVPTSAELCDLRAAASPGSIFKEGAAYPMDEVRERLSDLEQYLPDQHETTYEFARLLADRLNNQLVPAGFNLAAELLLHDLQEGVDGFSGEPINSSLAGQPEMIYALVRMRIPDITEAVCPKEFSEGVGGVISAVDQLVKEGYEAERQANPPKAIEIDLQDYYRRAQDISRYILETVNAGQRWGMENRTSESPNPFYSQIEPNGGLALEMYYSLPSDLCTPLGKLSIGGSGSGSQEAMEQIKEKLGLVEIVPVRHTREGTFGPIYAITKDLEGNTLPTAVLAKRVSYIDYNEAKKIWKDVKPEGRRD